MDWPAVLSKLTAGEDLDASVAADALQTILRGEATDAQIAAFLIGLRAKGESVSEVTAMVDVMLANATPIVLPPGDDAIDIVGTGGAPSRRKHALNVSTMACFVAAGAGARVLKHGNRKASSTSGSFDLLEALGVNVELDAQGVARCISETNIGFAFARSFHPAMRFAGPVRSELGVPTVFNFLGPLSNPAGIRRQVIGVSDVSLAPIVVGTLAERGAPRAFVVCADDGTDEISLSGATTITELRDGSISTYRFEPQQVGLKVVEAEVLAGGDAARNAEIAHSVFAGESSPVSDMVCLNAAAGLIAAGKADDWQSSFEMARNSVVNGLAAEKLQQLIAISNN
ncbi:MAG: anthranilate phosphoribosyltransferase [Actinomycetota bacterium]|jgi:anthranilate phosphoribosyltransferase